MPEAPLPDRYQVLEELCRGEAEILLRAKDKLLQREVVICKPRAGLLGPPDKQDLERSLRQARALARVSHPGVVRLLDVVETADGPVLAMEPMAGETIAERLARSGPLEPQDTLQLAIKLCEALEAVHAVGIVHRGISTGNVALRADGTPCLTGFAFAKFGGDCQNVAATTFLYKPKAGEKSVAPVLPPHPAPEQILGQAADARSDLFGLGWTLYECLTGEDPYPRELDVERWNAPKDPRSRNKSVPKSLSEAVLKCLAPSPLKRFASAAEMRAGLQGAVSATHGASAGRGGAGMKVGLAAAGVLVLGLVGWQLLGGGDKPAEARGDDTLRGVAAGVPNRGGFSERYRQSHALLIGIGEAYAGTGFSKLVNPVPDVVAIARLLDSIQAEKWQVSRLLDGEATRTGILAALAKLNAAAGPEDKVFVYYAGHGMPHENSQKSGWIVPAGARTVEEDPARADWLRFDEFTHLFDETKAKHVLVAMDCCYSGRIVGSRSGGASAFARAFVTQPAKVAITSGSAHQQVSDGVVGENSPFARAFLDVLSLRNTEGVTTSRIFSEIQTRLIAQEGGQSPMLGRAPGSPLEGEVVFFLK